MYQPIIEGHIKSIKSKGSSFKDATFFNTNACPCDGDVLMNLDVLNVHCISVFPIFRMQVCVSILFSLQVTIMVFNYFFIVLFIFVK
jgi:hypothetical protein